MIYSYTALTTLLFVATWFAFPLSASPQAAEAQVVDDTGVTVNTGGPILKRNDIHIHYCRDKLARRVLLCLNLP